MVNGMNDMTQTTLHENVSALADGQLLGDELARAVDALAADSELRDQWKTWHLIGDVMRTGQHVPCTDTTRFVAKLGERLAAEPAPLRAPLLETIALQRVASRTEAANQPAFRWKLVAGVASLAAAGAIGWNWIATGGTGAGAGAQLAVVQPAPASREAATAVATAEPSARTLVPTQVVVGTGSAPQVMLRDARLDQMLAAHQQAGGASQMPSAFLRNATFEGPSR